MLFSPLALYAALLIGGALDLYFVGIVGVRLWIIELPLALALWLVSSVIGLGFKRLKGRAGWRRR